MSQSNTFLGLVPWSLSLEDLESKNVEFIARYTCQVEDAHVPLCIQNLHGVHVAVCRTNGNGKCGLHAVLGVPNARELKVTDERALLLRIFNGTYSDLRTRMLQQALLGRSSAVETLDYVSSKIWPSFIKPFLEYELKGKKTAISRERSLYEDEMTKDNELLHTLRSHYWIQEHARQHEQDRKVYGSDSSV